MSVEYWRGFDDALKAVQRAGCTQHLAQSVHRIWRDGMISQGRDVAKQRMLWETLSAEDRELDASIARRLAMILVTRVRYGPKEENKE